MSVIWTPSLCSDLEPLSTGSARIPPRALRPRRNEQSHHAQVCITVYLDLPRKPYDHWHRISRRRRLQFQRAVHFLGFNETSMATLFKAFESHDKRGITTA